MNDKKITLTEFVRLFDAAEITQLILAGESIVADFMVYGGFVLVTDDDDADEVVECHPTVADTEVVTLLNDLDDLLG